MSEPNDLLGDVAILELMQYSLSALLQLLPLLSEFKEQFKSVEDIDIHELVQSVGQVFGIEDVDAFASDQFRNAMQEEMRLAFDNESAQVVADVIAAASTPVMSAIACFVQGKTSSTEMLSSIADVCLRSNETLCSAITEGLGIPPEIAKPITDKFGLHFVAVYCFTAAYKIYQQACRDAALAKEHRIAVEKAAAEACRRLMEERSRMEELVNNYLLERLVPVREGIAAMDKAILEGDDDGFIAANANLWELFGHESQYHNAEEFDELMLSDEEFVL